MCVHVHTHYVPMNKKEFDIIQWHQIAVYLEVWFGLIWKIWMFQKECFKLQVQSTNTSEICKCWDTQAAAVEVNIIIMLRYERWFWFQNQFLIPQNLFQNLTASCNSASPPRQSRRRGAWPRKNKMSSQHRRTSVKRSICSCLFLCVGSHPLKNVETITDEGFQAMPRNGRPLSPPDLPLHVGSHNATH